MIHLDHQSFKKIEGLYAPAFKLGVNIFSISFVLGVIVMVMALITKNGQWMKWATGSMIFLIYQHDVDETKCILLI